jgi:hypothetical protein
LDLQDLQDHPDILDLQDLQDHPDLLGILDLLEFLVRNLEQATQDG